jgi:hypothetical protein
MLFYIINNAVSGNIIPALKVWLNV